MKGTLFDSRYELIRLLGRGGFAEVWLVKDTLTGLEEALKIYAPGGGMDEDGLNVFAKELSVVHNLRHTNLLTPKTLGQYDSQPYLVLPYCPNGSLNKKVGACTEEEAWKIIEQVASGLAYLHKKGIIHQDIKPDNILIDENNDYVITDFGISMKAQSTLRKSMHIQAQSGTMAYMAPERFSTEPHPIPANDVWSLGAMVFELMEGEVPFFAQMGGLAQKNGADLPTMHADVSDALKQLVLSMLAKEADARPTAEQVVELAKKRQGTVSPAETPKTQSVAEQTPQPVDERKTQRVDDRKTQRIEPIPTTPEKKEVPKEGKPQNTSNPKRKKRIIGWSVAAAVLLAVGLIIGMTVLGGSKESGHAAVEEHVLIGGLYYDLYADNTAKVVGKVDDVSRESIIPSSVQHKSTTYAVISIGNSAFSKHRSLISVTIPNSVTSIGNEAFADCRNLSSIIIPNSVTKIGDHAFARCASLESVTIPNSVKSIGDFAFFGCITLKTVTIPNSVMSIGNYAFSDCYDLKSVKIPTHTKIGDHVFDQCDNMQISYY